LSNPRLTCSDLKIHCVPKNDAKIQITITTAHFIRINYPLFPLAALIIAFHKQMLQISTKSTARFLSNSFLKMELNNRIFQYGKYRLTYLLQEVLRIMGNMGKMGKMGNIRHFRFAGKLQCIRYPTYQISAQSDKPGRFMS